jgi:hypothetical protein
MYAFQIALVGQLEPKKVKRGTLALHGGAGNLVHNST